MDSIRGEVSNKIRSAIKAKLMELGAYVDDELPDYIMVMVANKRSRQQMEDDLLLFLGDSTITFTSWLHTVLSKLQQVTINSAELKKGSDKKRISSEDHKKEKHKKMKKEKLEHTDKIAGKGKHKESTVGSNDSQLRAHIIKSEPDEVNTHENPVLINIQEENKAVSISRSRSSALDPKSTQSKTTEEEDEDDFINLKADVETDMWCESEETSAAGIKNSNAELIPQPPKKTTSLEPLIQAAVPSQVNQLPESISEKIFSNTEPSASSNIALPKSPQADQKSTSKIIKISETIRQEQETVKPASKIVRDPQALVKRVFQSHIVSQRNMKDKSERSRKRSALSHTVEDQSRRSDQRRKKSSERVDLRDTLRKERLREREHKKDREREQRRSRGENQARKSQQTMTSIARAPLSHKDENESDHGLSSIVRVKPRPQIPAALQANKSLILKAVAEAQKSVSKAAVRSELTIKSLAKASITKKSAKDRLQLPKLSIRKTEPSNKDLLLLKQRTQLPSRETLRKMSFTVRTKETPAPKELDVQDFDNVSDESSIILDPSLNILIQVPASPVREGSHESADPVQAENVRKWIEDVEEATKSEVVPPCNNADLGADQDSFEALETSSKPGTGEGIENLDDALEVETSSLKTLDNTRVVMSVDQPMHRPSIGPQFVVTLDGLDPMLLRSFAVEEGQSNNILKQRSIDSINVSTNDDKEDDSVKEQLLREELLRQQAAVREQRAVNPSNAAVSPAPVLVNMLDKSSASPGNLLELRQPKVNTSKTPNIERCKFWPTCKNKDKCEFHHPSVQCKLFPNCKFADRCLYIHPTCRFNTSCTRADCVYTHTGPKPTHITPPKGTSHLGGQSIKQACKFFPHCSNPSCPFLHPTVCKFGTHCSKPKCQYIHSEKGLNSKHKWIRH